jgi:hypothetical protein
MDTAEALCINQAPDLITWSNPLSLCISDQGFTLESLNCQLHDRTQDGDSCCFWKHLKTQVGDIKGICKVSKIGGQVSQFQ